MYFDEREIGSSARKSLDSEVQISEKKALDGWGGWEEKPKLTGGFC